MSAPNRFFVVTYQQHPTGLLEVASVQAVPAHEVSKANARAELNARARGDMVDVELIKPDNLTVGKLLLDPPHGYWSVAYELEGQALPTTSERSARRLQERAHGLSAWWSDIQAGKPVRTKSDLGEIRGKRR